MVGQLCKDCSECDWCCVARPTFLHCSVVLLQTIAQPGDFIVFKLVRLWGPEGHSTRTTTFSLKPQPVEGLGAAPQHRYHSMQQLSAGTLQGSCLHILHTQAACRGPALFQGYLQTALLLCMVVFIDCCNMQMIRCALWSFCCRTLTTIVLSMLSLMHSRQTHRHWPLWMR
jgi:hypothetical protein